jgi:serine/threonine protein kinase
LSAKGRSHVGYERIITLLIRLREKAKSGLQNRGKSYWLIIVYRERPVNEELEVVGNLRATDHPRLVNLIEAFQDQSIYLVYRFHGFTVDLGRVYARSQAQLNDVEIATICKHILQGLQYIHSVLNIAHGDLCARNILLYEDGQIRIGKDHSSGQND